MTRSKCKDLPTLTGRRAARDEVHVRGFADVGELTIEIVVKYTEHDLSHFS